jgi:hypothetical protein
LPDYIGGIPVNILRATYIPLEPDACGVQDKGSTHQAPKQDGRASLPDYTLRRQFCDCGKPATVKRNNSKICQRCADIDSKSPPYVVGKRRYWGAPTQREYSVTLGGWE